MEIEKRFVNQLRELRIELPEDKEQMFEKYYRLLIFWNGRINLTAITEKGLVYEKHFLDSLSLVKAVNIEEISEGVKKAEKEEGIERTKGGCEVLDIGTGAGFPGIPLKIVFPQMKMVLLDSLEKRVKFLEEVVKELEIESTHCLHGRAEAFARKEEYRQGFDLVVSRAVTNLSVLSEYALPFVKVGGFFVAYKSSEIKEEVEMSKNAIEVLGGQIKKEVTFNLPGTNISRTLLKIEKVLDTPEKYPRRAGKPEKKPL